MAVVCPWHAQCSIDLKSNEQQPALAQPGKLNIFIAAVFIALYSL